MVSTPWHLIINEPRTLPQRTRLRDPTDHRACLYDGCNSGRSDVSRDSAGGEGRYREYGTLPEVPVGASLNLPVPLEKSVKLDETGIFESEAVVPLILKMPIT